MTNNDRRLLAFILNSERALSERELVAMIFVLSSGKDPVYQYDFIWLNKEFYSVELERSLENLKKQDLFIRHADCYGKLTKSGKVEAFKIGFDELEKIKKASSSVLSMDESELFESVQQMKKDKTALKKTQIAIYTSGYEGESPDNFFNKLIDAGVKRVLDVRSNPISRKYGFSKKVMQQICNKLNFEYIHSPEVGIPSNLRRDLKTENDYKKLLDDYEKTILASTDNQQEALAALIQEKPSVLVCFEENPACCHRSRLAKSLSKKTGLEVIHL